MVGLSMHDPAKQAPNSLCPIFPSLRPLQECESVKTEVNKIRDQLANIHRQQQDIHRELIEVREGHACAPLVICAMPSGSA